jgi:hypothetical protein
MLRTSQRYLSREAVAAASLMNPSSMTPAQKRQRRLPFDWALHANPEATQLLSQHPEGYPPLQMFLHVARHYPIPPSEVARLLQEQRADSCTSSWRRVAALLLRPPFPNEAPPWQGSRGVQNAMCMMLLHRGLAAEAAELFVAMRTDDVSVKLWGSLVEAASTKKLRHSTATWKLVSMENFPVFRSTHGGDKEAANSLLHDRENATPDGDAPYSWIAGGETRVLPGASTSTSVAPQAHIVHGLSADQAARLLDGAGLSLSIQATVSIALEVMKRYVQTCRLTAGSSPLLPIDPQPFLIFFIIAREARDPQTNLPLLHWHVVWEHFQFLNRHNPRWYEVCGDATEQVCLYIVEVLVRGADPWLTLNVSRALARRHIVDGVTMSIWLMRRLTLVHYPNETKEIASKLFNWLMDEVGIHLLPNNGVMIEKVVRALLQLEQYEDLARLYNALVDNFFDFPDESRRKILDILSDLVCPFCSSMLKDTKIFEERTCQVCMATVEAKDSQELPSYAHSPQIKAAISEHIREKRRNLRRKARAQLSATKSQAHQERLDSSRLPELDAAVVLQRQVVDAPLFIPGVAERSPAAARPLFSRMSGTEEERAGTRAAMEEQRKKRAMQVQARRLALEQRGVDLPPQGGEAVAHAVPSSVPSSYATYAANRAAALDSSRAEALLASKWTCVWCLEENGEMSSRTVCRACGAETGPLAQWRTFSSGDRRRDTMKDLRTHLLLCDKAEDAIVAAYNLMVYRRLFLLRAVESDLQLVEGLVLRLAQAGQKVLAGFLYMRLLPPKSRQMNETVLELGRVFGCVPEEELVSITNETLRDDQTAFGAVFSDSTCRACFGSHSWTACPMVTRDFTKTSVKPTMAADDHRHLEVTAHLLHLVRSATTQPEVRIAYHAFLRSKSHRELFAQAYPLEANKLAALLCHFDEHVRAAFVLCHIAYPQRQSQVYADVAARFGVAAEDTREILAKRSASDVDDDSHPNFVQVALTCCICLDGRHASYQCPMFAEWHAQAITAQRRLKPGESIPETMLQLNERESFRRHSRLLALVDGWSMSGPERLHAFYRFLIEHIEEYSDVRVDTNGAAYYGLNKCIAKLALTGRRAYAFRLYARSPAEFISGATLAEVLRLRNVSDDVIFQCRASAVVDPKWRSTAIPQDCCLVCFQPDHTLYTCPEVQAAGFPLDALHYVVAHVGGIRCSPSGAIAACAYFNQVYQFGQLQSEALRARPQLILWLLRLVEKCMTFRLLTIGVRTMRRIHLDLVPLSTYTAFWTAAECSPEQIEQLQRDLEALYARFSLAVLEDVTAAATTPRQTFPNEFMEEWGNIVFRHVCRHCFEPNHMIEHCATFAQEVSFSRDIISVYRAACMHRKTTDDFLGCTLARLARFVLQHAPHLPMYIFGVHKAVNSIAASLATMTGWIGPSVRLTLSLPPAYRMFHVTHLQLHTRILNYIANEDERLDEIDRRMAKVRWWEPAVDPVTKAVQSHALIEFRNPEQDVLYKSIFQDIPGIDAMLQHADGLILRAIEVEGGVDEKAFIAAEMCRETETKNAVVGSTSVAVQKQPSAPKKISPVQVSTIVAMREMFEPIMTDMETLAQCKLGSRMVIMLPEITVEDARKSEVFGTPQQEQPPTQAAEAAAVRQPTLIEVESKPVNNGPHPNPTAAQPQRQQTHVQPKYHTTHRDDHHRRQRNFGQGNRSHSGRQQQQGTDRSRSENRNFGRDYRRDVHGAGPRQQQ